MSSNVMSSNVQGLSSKVIQCHPIFRDYRTSESAGVCAQECRVLAWCQSFSFRCFWSSSSSWLVISSWSSLFIVISITIVIMVINIMHRVSSVSSDIGNCLLSDTSTSSLRDPEDIVQVTNDHCNVDHHHHHHHHHHISLRINPGTSLASPPPSPAPRPPPAQIHQTAKVRQIYSLPSLHKNLAKIPLLKSFFYNPHLKKCTCKCTKDTKLAISLLVVLLMLM